MAPFMHLVRPTVAAPAATTTAAPADVKIQTSALFQILEILAKLVLPDQGRVIGTLVGVRSDDGSEFEVRDAFLVPTQETGESIAIEEQTHKTLYQLYKKAHPKEYVLGWFGSSEAIDSTTGLIHDFYLKGADRAYPFPAIYLNVDFLDGSKQVTVPRLTAYIGAAVGKPTGAHKVGWKTVGGGSAYIFTPIPHQVVNGTASEKLAVSLLARNTEGLVVLAEERSVSQLSREIKAVCGNIDQLLNYINTLTTATDSDVDLLRTLSDQLLNKPQVLQDLDELKNLFRAHNQDVIMVEYLTKAVKEQIELSARLTAETDKK